MHLVTGEAVPLPMTDKGGPWRAWAGAPFLSMSSFQVRAPPGSSLREGREKKRSEREGDIHGTWGRGWSVAGACICY